jgi:CTP:molybdopterin cytidylyltransferase MocA
MFTSILAGLVSLESSVDGFFLLPADIPLVKPTTYFKLHEGYNVSGKDIIYPVYAGKRGHPPLISSRFFPYIFNYDGAGGLKALLNEHAELAHHVEVNDEGILLDMDKYEDYLKLHKSKSQD